MTNSSKNFELALTYPVSYSVQDNKFDSKEKFPKMGKLTIPIESAYEFAQHIMSLCDNEKYHKDIFVYDMNTNEKIPTKGVVIWGKGKVGNYDEDGYGAYGSFNPKKAEVKQVPQEMKWDSSPVVPETDEFPF
tara:strand:+ start:368 stop:766 length:399 start_codon:yes stop_codon:yes gene_type:complete